MAVACLGIFELRAAGAFNEDGFRTVRTSAGEPVGSPHPNAQRGTGRDVRIERADDGSICGPPANRRTIQQLVNGSLGQSHFAATGAVGDPDSRADSISRFDLADGGAESDGPIQANGA